MRIVLHFVVFATLFNSVYLNGNKSAEVATNVIISKRYKGFIKNILNLFNLIRRTNHENDTYLEDLFYQNNTLKDEDVTLDWFAQGMYAPNATRRQRQSKESMKLHEMLAKAKEEEPKEDGINEPYWQSGEWVFLRTGTPTTIRTSTQWWETTTTERLVDIYRECDRSCSAYFYEYGQICGHRYNTHKWINEYENFETICDLELKNCEERNKRPMWHPLHRGKCTVISDNFPYERDIGKILAKKKKYDPYVYTTTKEPTGLP